MSDTIPYPGESQIKLLLDKEAIRDVISRYSFNVDIKRIDNALRLWTDDLVFTTDFEGKPVDLKGKAQLKQFLIDPNKDPFTLHLQIDIVVTVDGDEAYAAGYQIIPIANNGKIEIVRCSFRSFNLRRINDNWLIYKAKSENIENTEGCRALIPEEW